MNEAIRAISELFLLIGIGNLLARFEVPLLGKFTVQFWKEVARFAYCVGIPSLVLILLGRFRLEANLWEFIVTTAVVSMAMIVTAVSVSHFLPVAGGLRRVAAAISHQPNSVFLGFPLITAVLGQDMIPKAAIVAIIEMALAMTVGVAFLGEAASDKHDSVLRVITARLVRDPFVASVFFGVTLSIIGAMVHLPETVTVLPSAIENTLYLLGSTASPLALLCIGSGLTFRRSDIFGAVLISAIRIVLAPLVILGVLAFFQNSDNDRLMIVLLLSAPVAVSATVMVEHYGLEQEARLARQALTFSTLASLITFSVIIACLK